MSPKARAGGVLAAARQFGCGKASDARKAEADAALTADETEKFNFRTAERRDTLISEDVSADHIHNLEARQTACNLKIKR
jgi:hypothetical protein